MPQIACVNIFHQ